jgi:hypothetical protein
VARNIENLYIKDMITKKNSAKTYKITYKNLQKTLQNPTKNPTKPYKNLRVKTGPGRYPTKPDVCFRGHL